MREQTVSVGKSKSGVSITAKREDIPWKDDQFFASLPEITEKLFTAFDFIDNEVDYVIANIRKSTQTAIDGLAGSGELTLSDKLHQVFNESAADAVYCAVQFNNLIENMLREHYRDGTLPFQCHVSYPENLYVFFLRKAQDKLIQKYPEYAKLCSEENILRLVKEQDLIFNE